METLQQELNRKWLEICAERIALTPASEHQMHGHFVVGESVGVCSCGAEFVSPSNRALEKAHDDHRVAFGLAPMLERV